MTFNTVPKLGFPLSDKACNTLAALSLFSCQRRHALRACDDSQRMHDKGGIIPALFQASFQIGHYIFFRLKMLGRVPMTDFHFAHHSLYIEIRCKFARFEDISLLRGFAAATEQNDQHGTASSGVHTVARSQCATRSYLR